MKTPEGIKSELKKYGSGEEWDVSKECAKLCKRALAYIKRLEAELQREKDQHQYTIDAANVMKDEALKFESRLAQAERERDALRYDLASMPNACDVCVHGVQDDHDCDELFGHNNGCEFKWRGVCPENTEEEE